MFPKKRWLGLAPVLFGFGQAAGHGLIFNRLAKDRYSPGFLASLLLHIPIGIQYLNALRDEAPIEHNDWRNARFYMIAFAASGVAAPNFVLRNKNSPYRFTAKQVGRHTAPPTNSSAAPQPNDHKPATAVSGSCRRWQTSSVPSRRSACSP